MVFSTKALLAASVALIAVPAPVFAQSADPTPPAANPPASPVETKPSDADSGVKEIIVTATRRAQNLQTVPTVVAAFDHRALEAQGIQSQVDLPKIVPGLNVNTVGVATNLYLRGVGTFGLGYSAESEVATYLDGVYLPNAAATLFSFNNIERVEVLKGPQGTLYGRNTTGGLVNIITRDPGSATHVDGSIQYGNYQTIGGNLYVGTPITDRLGVSLAFTGTDQHDGWGRNVFNGDKAFTFRQIGLSGKMKWRPTDTTTITLRGTYVDVHTDEGNAFQVFPGATAPDGTTYLGRYQVSDRISAIAHSSVVNVGLTISQDLGPVDLESITGFTRSSTPSQSTARTATAGNPTIPLRGALFSILDASTNSFSQELKISSKSRPDSHLDWLAGIFYYNDDTDFRYDSFSSCNATQCSAPNAASYTPNTLLSYPKTHSYAAYGEATYHVTDRDRVTLGLRYTLDQKELNGSTLPLAGYPNSAIFPVTVNQRLAKDFSNWTYKAVYAHDFSDRIHAYTSYNKGFKSGGYQVGSAFPAFNPETLNDYEIGLKSDLFDRMLRVNVAGFYYDYKNLQVTATVPGTTSAFTYNAAAARVKGVDADFVFAPGGGLTINGSAEYLDAKYTSFPNAFCVIPITGIPGVIGGNRPAATCNAGGNRLPLAPTWSFTIGAQYVVETSIGRFTLAASDSYKSRFFWAAANRISQAPYHLIDASLTLALQGGKYDAQLFARNLTNRYYYTFAGESSVDSGTPGAPRTYGVKFGFHF